MKSIFNNAPKSPSNDASVVRSVFAPRTKAEDEVVVTPESAAMAIWIRGQEDVSKSSGLKITKLNLSVEALESLNAHVPDLGLVRAS